MEKGFKERLGNVRAKDIGHVFLFILAILPSIIYKYTHKPFWVVSEYKDEARDNGYWFFKYVRENHPEQGICYAVGRESKDYEKVKALGKTVRHGSFMHWILYLACTCKISSQKAGGPNYAVCYILELYLFRKKKIVFLQHGIIKDDLPYIHHNQANFSLFATTTKREYEYVRDNFGFPDGVVKQTGLCRFDDLQDCSDGNTILIMPTWRQWLSDGMGNAMDLPFEDTEYYKNWMEFLGSMDKLLENTKKEAVFYLHRNMQGFTKFFHTECNRVKILTDKDADVHELLKSSSLLVTDYSSVAMDFAYMHKPVVYFQFDYDRFREEHLPTGYFSYKNDGFGPVTRDAMHVLGETEKAVRRHFFLEAKYKSRIRDFFDMADSGNCKKTYDAIKELGV